MSGLCLEENREKPKKGWSSWVCKEKLKRVFFGRCEMEGFGNWSEKISFPCFCQDSDWREMCRGKEKLKNWRLELESWSFFNDWEVFVVLIKQGEFLFLSLDPHFVLIYEYLLQSFQMYPFSLTSMTLSFFFCSVFLFGFSGWAFFGPIVRFNWGNKMGLMWA